MTTVEAGEVIADGPSTQFGELALGRNVLVAFMPWNGYNYEDSILISERIVKDDVFTSIHIEEFEVMARDTKLGPEDITRDIPNVGEEALRNLDEAGIVYIGAEVEPGDILCRQDHAQGRKPDDAGGKAPPRDLRREGVGRPRHLAAPAAGRPGDGRRSARVQPPRHRHRRPHPRHPDRGEGAPQEGRRRRARHPQPRDLLAAEGNAAQARSPPRRPRASRRAQRSTTALLEAIERHEWWKIAVKDDKRQADIEALKAQYDEAVNVIVKRFEDRVEKLERGDELPPGVLKMVKVFVAVKRKLQPGDKMAGRHGNKGVISRILPNEDMPFLEDGTPVDIVLNPLGVPSRMNVGQIFETHLGWAARGLGQQIQEMLDGIHERGKDIAGKDVKAVRAKLKDIYGDALRQGASTPATTTAIMDLASNLVGGIPMGTPVFDGAREADVSDMLRDGRARQVGPGGPVRRPHRRRRSTAR